MTKHPLDRDRTFEGDKRAAEYARIERESGPEGSHPAAKAALKRARQEIGADDLVRAKTAEADKS